MKSRDLIRELERAGWRLVRIRGSHHIFEHPDRDGLVVVPHPRGEIGAGLLSSIRKQAGLR